MSSPADLEEKAIHEVGHLVVLSHVFGGLGNPDLRVVFATLRSYGPSGGCVNWNPGSDRDTEKISAVALAGFYANLYFGSDEDIERYRDGARDDAEQVAALALSQERLEAVNDRVIDLIDQQRHVIRGVADELLEWETFYGYEALGVVHAHMYPADAPGIRTRLQEYRDTREGAIPPAEWKLRGDWSEPFEAWLLRRYPRK